MVRRWTIGWLVLTVRYSITPAIRPLCYRTSWIMRGCRLGYNSSGNAGMNHVCWQSPRCSRKLQANSNGPPFLKKITQLGDANGSEITHMSVPEWEKKT